MEEPSPDFDHRLVIDYVTNCIVCSGGYFIPIFHSRQYAHHNSFMLISIYPPLAASNWVPREHPNSHYPGSTIREYLMILHLSNSIIRILTPVFLYLDLEHIHEFCHLQYCISEAFKELHDIQFHFYLFYFLFVALSLRQLMLVFI